MKSVAENRRWATLAAVLGFSMTLLYVLIILVEGNDSFSEIFPWALTMATGAALAAASIGVSKRGVARVLLFGSAAILGIVGWLAILSIGVGFLLAAGAAVIGGLRVPSDPPENR